MSQSRDLVLLSLGNDGSTARWFGPPLEPGVHLRWTFAPALGFPARGFTLFRRTHRPGTLVALDAAPGVRELAPPELARRVEVQFARSGPVPSASRLPRVVALFGGVPVAHAQSRVIGSRIVASVSSDAIDTVRIVAPVVWRVQRARYVPEAQDDQTGWQRLLQIGPARDVAEAVSRLPDAVVAYYVGSAGAPASGWANLRALVDEMVQPPIPKTAVMSGPDEASPTACAPPADLLLLASIDPYVARLAGLCAVDGGAAAGQAYDYRIVGHWIKTQIAAPETVVTFESSFRGHRFVQTFFRDGVIFRCANRAAVERLADAPWRDTRHMLDLGRFTASAVPGAAPYVRIQLDEPAAEVQLYLRVIDGRPEAIVPDGTASLTRWVSADGGFAILSLAARSAAEPIEAVLLRPMGETTSLHVGVAKLGLRRTWMASLGEARSWTCYNVSRAAPDALPAPQEVTAAPLSTPARELPNGGIAGGARAALNWDVHLQGTVLAPGEPVRYLVQRQSLGSGSAAAAVDPSTWETIRRTDSPALPVTVGTGEGSSYLYVDDPAAAAGQVQPDRFYAYRVAAIDLFGRLGPYGPPGVADLTDTAPPPAPADLEARYLDPADPLLAAEERAWVEAESPPRSGIRVRWSWPAPLRTQAPDAREFRVYVKRGALNTIAGRITALVAANADGTFTLATDATLPDTAAGALAGETLRTGDVSFRIVDNTAGTAISIVVAPADVPPPAMPAPGAFTISLRAPRPLEGAIVSVKHHLSGLVTVRTDRTTELPPNALAGRMLRQGGREHRIFSNTTGTLTLVVQGIGSPPRRPTKGRFAVSDAVANAANALWTDYRDAARWDEQVTAVSLTTVDRYEAIVPYGLHVSADVPVAAASVGVTTADAGGNEGAVSTPVIVQRAIRQPPARPAAPDVADSVARAADFHGTSYVRVQWTRPAGVRVELFRAMDETIFAADRRARPARSTDRLDYPYLSDAQFNSLIAVQPDYAALSDDLLTALASLPGNDAAFGLLTPEPLDADRFRAAFAGRSANRHLFALRLVDPAGNRSALGWPSRAVRPLQALAPRAPIVTNVLGGDRAVTLRWASNREPDLREYRIYRTTDKRDAEDVRLMTLVQTVPVVEIDPAARPAEMQWRDAAAAPFQPIWYRLVAANVSGNLSKPSRAAVASAYDDTRPDPPTWNPPQPTPSGGLLLSWIPVAADLQSLVERRRAGLGGWTSISAWLPGGTSSFADVHRQAGLTYEYRLRVTNSVGRQNATFEVLRA